ADPASAAPRRRNGRTDAGRPVRSVAAAASAGAREPGGVPERRQFRPHGREVRRIMKHAHVGLVLAMTLAAGWCATAAEDPPKELTPEERKELEAQWKELTETGVKHYQSGKLAEAAEALEKALEAARRLHPKQDHPQLATSLSNLARVLRARGQYAD